MTNTQTPSNDPSNNDEATMTKKTITAFKGFDENLKCRGYQFEVGKTYEHDGDVVACSSGFHACENPFDVWNYYELAESRFATVTLGGKTSKHGDDTKIAAAKITIEAELKLPQFIKAAVDFIIAATKAKNDKAKIGSSGYSAKIGSSGYSAQIGSSGDSAKIGSSGNSAKIGSSGDSAKIGSSGYSAQIGSSGDSAQIGSSGDYAKIGSSGYSAKIGSSGYSAQIGSSGDYAKIGSSGDSAQIGSSGYSAKIGSSGYSAQIGSSGDYAQIGSSGNSAKIGSSGDYAKIGSSGYSAQIEIEGENSIASTVGPNGRIKAPLGTPIAIAEYDSSGKPICFATGVVGQDGIEPDTWYIAKGGKLVAA